MVLTNVSLVRYRRGGKRFEVGGAANADCVLQEQDLDEVVQIENVFLNVSKGQVAPNEDLNKAFGTTNVSEILIEILKKGELQVGDKERSHELTNLWREIATQLAQSCVEPASQKPYTVGMIEKAMKEVHYSVKTGKSAKSQSLDVLKLLQAKNTIPIQRARMRVRVTLAPKDGKRLKDKLVALFEDVEDEDYSDEWELIGTIEPGSLRQINTLIEEDAKGHGSVETLSFAAVDDDDDDDWH